ncbi:threonine synthase [Aminobacter lissarensis]|uniref:Threonine synthase n=1 Tax=Aminobacter carboxidus TaxID=376165 RepID=A0A8E2BEQ0_9HYPH|nr:threonine synthase [Aminobacter lissarensis]
MTPLLPAERLGEALGVPQLFIKDEGRNPTGSHKDRFSTVAVSMARAQGARVLATASSGNAGASLAAYAAKSGLGCVVATFAGAAGPMLSQIHAYGASVIPMADKSDRWKLLERAADRLGWFVTSPYQHPVVGSHPLGIEGYKTIAYEITEQADGHLPDWCVLPVCYGDALAGVAAGFHDLHSRGKIARVPRLVAAEVYGSLSKALENGFDRIEEQEPSFETIALSIGTTRSTYQAVKALRDTGGHAVCVSNEQLMRMQKMLAAREGFFVELASVAPLVAIQHLRERQIIAPDDRVVAVVTATGLKDLDISANPATTQAPFESVEAAWQWATGKHAAEPAAA